MVAPKLHPRESHTDIVRQHTGSRHASAVPLSRGGERNQIKVVSARGNSRYSSRGISSSKSLRIKKAGVFASRKKVVPGWALVDGSGCCLKLTAKSMQPVLLCNKKDHTWLTQNL